MSSLTPTFQGEIQFRRYSDTSTQGQQVVFAVQDREALECFIGKEGKRFMAVLVEVGDDEQPVKSDIGIPTSAKPREQLGDLCWRAVQWCKEPEFAEFLSRVFYEAYPRGMSAPAYANDDAPGREAWCKYALQVLCSIGSRKELDTNPEAARKFNQLIRGPYQKHLIARGIVR